MLDRIVVKKVIGIKQKNIEIVEVSTMKELGKIGGIDVNSSAILTLE